jgi:hypothetical protein
MSVRRPSLASLFSTVLAAGVAAGLAFVAGIKAGLAALQDRPRIRPAALRDAIHV